MMDGRFYHLAVGVGLALCLVCMNAAAVRAQDTVGVALEYDSAAVFTMNAGEEIRFELVARDENLDVFEQWDQLGRDIILTVDSSYAETDTSARSWSADPDGYSWLRLRLNGSMLTADSVVQFPRNPRLYYTIPHSRFVNGRATLHFAQSQAARGIVLSVDSNRPDLPRQSPPITVCHGPIENLLVTITSPTQGPDRVFLLRRYEIVVWPRDRYMNDVSDTTVRVAFTARFPNEFDLQPGTSDIFSSTIDLRGVTNYYISSRVRRMDSMNDERQWVLAYSPDDTTISGRTNPYEILDHAPNSFTLLQPADSTELTFMASSHVERFTWSKAEPQDPYTNIQISMFDPSTFSDEVTYTIGFLDAASMTRMIRFQSDNHGADSSFTITHADLYDLVDQLSHSPVPEEHVVWFVTATDQLYITESSPPSHDTRYRAGFYLTIHRRVTPGVQPMPEGMTFTLHPNYPNPFNPGTEIPVELHVSGHCWLQVLDLMG